VGMIGAVLCDGCHVAVIRRIKIRPQSYQTWSEMGSLLCSNDTLRVPMKEQKGCACHLSSVTGST
jgi:hypothetical protein